MITYETPKFWRSTWFLALLVGAGLGAATWWWQAHGAVRPPETAADAKPAPPPAPRPAVDTNVPPPAVMVAPKVASDGRPTDFTPEDWAALKAAMAQTAHPRAELERVVKYLRFQKGVERWQSLQDSADVAYRRQLAAKLLDQVPERLRQGEVTMGEALMLQAALISDIEPDEALRTSRLAAAQDALKAAAPQPDRTLVAREAAQQVEYKRREAAILADYKAQPEDQRSQTKLEAALESARRSVYGAGP